MSDLMTLQESIDRLSSQWSSFQSAQEAKNRGFEAVLSTLTGEEFPETEETRENCKSEASSSLPVKRLCQTVEPSGSQGGEPAPTTIQSANLKWEYETLQDSVTK